MPGENVSVTAVEAFAPSVGGTLDIESGGSIDLGTAEVWGVNVDLTTLPGADEDGDISISSINHGGVGDDETALRIASVGSIATTGPLNIEGPIAMQVDSDGDGAEQISISGPVSSGFGISVAGTGLNDQGIGLGNLTVDRGEGPLVSDIIGTPPVLEGEIRFTDLNCEVSCPGDLIFSEPYILTENTTFTANDILFESTLDSDSSATPRSLVLNANDAGEDVGTVSFLGDVGSNALLASLTVNSQSQPIVIGGSVSTDGGQAYTAPVVFADGSSRLSSSRGGISFAREVNGPVQLDIDALGRFASAKVFKSYRGSTSVPVTSSLQGKKWWPVTLPSTQRTPLRSPPRQQRRSWARVTSRSAETTSRWRPERN